MRLAASSWSLLYAETLCTTGRSSVFLFEYVYSSYSLGVFSHGVGSFALDEASPVVSPSPVVGATTLGARPCPSTMLCAEGTSRTLAISAAAANAAVRAFADEPPAPSMIDSARDACFCAAVCPWELSLFKSLTRECPFSPPCGRSPRKPPPMRSSAGALEGATTTAATRHAIRTAPATASRFTHRPRRAPPPSSTDVVSSTYDSICPTRI
eukprot:CAMPEP_0180198954 /NCGR_PEP_ID=MMETSP0987-20121128/5453_1 /TAXON_ID=697907 /ORGANISM="non described non described, Strain CCMP2293" /LENGTH=210 /DNA_ID=CAMNT_0022154011 /DNA_START=235 /DNA_END=868 /DNA_ORIENTATION=-